MVQTKRDVGQCLLHLRCRRQQDEHRPPLFYSRTEHLWNQVGVASQRVGKIGFHTHVVTLFLNGVFPTLFRTTDCMHVRVVSTFSGKWFELAKQVAEVYLVQKHPLLRRMYRFPERRIEEWRCKHAFKRR